MKKLNYLLLFAILAIVLFQTCKTKENLTDNGTNQTNNQQISNNDTIPKHIKNKVIAIGNDKDSIKTNIEKKVTVSSQTNDDTLVPILTITEPEYDPDPPREYLITAPIPKIVAELFPDYEWKLFVNNEGHNKYYSTTVGNRRYGYSVLNNMVESKYTPGEISDKQLIELFAFLLFHPYYNNMEIKSTQSLETMFRGNYNYKTIIAIGNEIIEFYSLVMDNTYIGCFAIKNNKMIKQITIK